MTDVWLVVGAVGVATIAIKATGPVLLGGRSLPPRLADVVELLAPAVLAALVVTQAVGGDGQIVLDERVPALAAAAVALVLRAPLLLVVVVAAVTAALLRAI
jgi:branched chain amino acid efflux pump